MLYIYTHAHTHTKLAEDDQKVIFKRDNYTPHSFDGCYKLLLSTCKSKLLLLRWVQIDFTDLDITTDVTGFIGTRSIFSESDGK